MASANERWLYNLTSSFIDQAHIEYGPCTNRENYFQDTDKFKILAKCEVWNNSELKDPFWGCRELPRGIKSEVGEYNHYPPYW